ncbi:MAG: hypothetical protein ABIA76_02385 [Candidatus Diapherotrites archaeon]
METVLVNFRLRKNMLNEMDSAIKEGFYDTRTELVKSSVRKEISECQKKKLIASLRKRMGEGKRLGIKEPTEEEAEKIREKSLEESLKKKGLI